ncbi:thiamine pyrophosphate-binding protein [Sulfuracidifex tepidarius]|uniref:2-oxoacid oxidoreductase (ferredoxin) n=1 Tax=Sulfuracidifex tepidarius TaxID=1294262 RepID=A0A510E5M4_9CREN|nr:thiamine pyrophosphate-binding protein [Sulfuracidifex tepidarius]BBG24562.1 3D-(3,5/4)-trihydroxycyclohexane-1,2-dione hydrolase [Sulfuracidifex tepidarius]BBG27350.1 3D-(3,5/4)-trihydroxycyclohexane-1,2-dione hydrolase [Sulfuracidifex tepidarius]
MSQPKRKEETLGREMSGHEALACVLREIGIKVVFSTFDLPNFIAEALKSKEIKVESSPTARGAVLMADSFARENNTTGVVIQIPGSGLLQAVDVVAQAFMDSVPLLLISSMRSYRDAGRARIGELKTNDDLSAVFAPITKFRDKIISIEEITVNIEKANKESLSNRNRPSYIEVAEDLFKLKAYPLSTAGQKPEKRTPDKTTAAKVAELLLNATRPVIIAGYGVVASDAEKDLRELIELLDIPLISTFRAKGVIPSSHQLYAGEGIGLVGTQEGNRILEQADVVVALGTRLDQLSTGGWTFKIKGNLAHNNIDGEDVGKTVMPQLPIVADTGLFVKEVLNIVKSKVKDKIDRDIRKEITVYRKGIILNSHADIWPFDVIRLLSQLKNYSKVFVDLSATTIDSVRLPIENTKSWFTSTSMIQRGLALGGVARSIDSRTIGITDIKGIIENLELLQSRIDKSKGKLLIFNDGGSNYIDTSRSDVPFIMKSETSYQLDSKLEKGLGAITVSSYSELKDALKEEQEKLQVLNIKLDVDFSSIVLERA